MDQAEFEKLVERVIESSTKQPDRQKTLRAVARRLIAVIGLLTLLVTVGGFFLDGFSFFTRTLPRATAVVAKRILLSDNFRSLLVAHVAKQLAYDKLCTIDHQVVDFDGDGERTDLIIEFRAPGKSGCEDYSHDIAYAMLKETEWKGVWPKYTVLTTLTKREVGFPLSFTQVGRFLVAETYGTDFPGVAVFGYANGTIKNFGQFSALGAKIKNPQAQPRAQIGNKLFLLTDDGIIKFEVTANGEFKQERLGSFEVFKRNNAAVLLEDNPTDRKPWREWGGKYEVTAQSIPECTREVFINGEPVTFDRRENNTCLADIRVARTSVITPNVPCNYSGFVETDQFPWGRVLDPAEKEHTIGCPIDGDAEGPPPFRVIVSIGPDN